MKVATNPLAEFFCESRLIQLLNSWLARSLFYYGGMWECKVNFVVFLYAVLAEPVQVFKIIEKHVGIKVTLFN